MGDTLDLGAGPLRVGEITVEPLRNRLRRHDQAVVVEPKVMDLLLQLAAFPDSVQTRVCLIDKIWGLKHGGDESLTRAVSGLRHAINSIHPDEEYIETIPKRGYRLIATVEPIGSKEPKDHRVSGFAPRQSQPNLYLIAIGLLIFVAIFTVSTLLPASDGQKHRLDRLALGVIVPQSSEPAAIELANALEASLVSELTLGGVEVVRGAESSSAVLRLTGAIRGVGEDAIVTIQLDESVTHQTLWSRQFELTGDVNAMVRNRIPWIVGDTVSCGLLGNSFEGNQLSDTKLIGYFLRSCSHFRTDGDFNNLLVQSRMALAHSPQNPVAKVRFANAAAWAAMTASSDEERFRLIKLSMETSDGLIADYPDYGIAHYAKGIAHSAASDWASARTELRTALELSPEYSYTLNALSNVSANLGQSEEALDLKRQAVISDRFALFQRVHLALMLAERNQVADALAIVRSLEPLDPRAACNAEFAIHHWWGNPLDALEMEENGCLSREISEKARACVKRFLNYRLGRATPSAAFGACKNGALWPSERYAVATGFVDEAYSIAMESEVNAINPWFLFRTEMRPLWMHPRFMEIPARYGLTKAWIETGRWPDFCSDPSLPYNCKSAAANLEGSGVYRKSI